MKTMIQKKMETQYFRASQRNFIRFVLCDNNLIIYYNGDYLSTGFLTFSWKIQRCVVSACLQTSKNNAVNYFLRT